MLNIVRKVSVNRCLRDIRDSKINIKDLPRAEYEIACRDVIKEVYKNIPYLKSDVMSHSSMLSSHIIFEYSKIYFYLKNKKYSNALNKIEDMLYFRCRKGQLGKQLLILEYTLREGLSIA